MASGLLFSFNILELKTENRVVVFIGRSLSQPAKTLAINKQQDPSQTYETQHLFNKFRAITKNPLIKGEGWQFFPILTTLAKLTT